MSDLFDSPDPERGSRQLKPDTTAPNWKEVSVTLTPGSLALHRSTTADGPVLICQRVSKWYGPVIGVNQVSLELRPGITGLVGSNGAGKSTLMGLITGHLRPDLGRIEVLGVDAWLPQAKRNIGYCPDVDVFYEEMSGRTFVETMARLSGFSAREARQRTAAVLDQVGMTGRAERSVRGYSKGMRQRIKLAQALLHDPALLVLDEPMSGIDPVGRGEFITLCRQLAAGGKCLLISSHELDELEKLTDQIIIMARGRIAVVGSVAQIRDRLDDHPLTIRIQLDPGREDLRRLRQLASLLLELPDVVRIEIQGADMAQHLLVQAGNPQQFFVDLARLIREGWFEVNHLETIDDSTQAVLGYLLGAGRPA